MSSSTKMLVVILLVALSTQSIFGAANGQNPLNLKKHHGAMCDVCEALVEGGEQVGVATLDAWLDVNIVTLCYTMLLPIHKECVEEIESLKAQLEQDIINKDAPKVACEGLELC